MFTRESVKRELKAKGWSYRRAAQALDRSYQHLSDVLNGKRQSRSLLRRISDLPKCPVPYTPSGFASHPQPR